MATRALPSILYLDQWSNKLNSTRKKIAALILFLIFFTKCGFPNILYLLQYAGCILKLIPKKAIKAASETARYNTRVHLYDIDFWFHMNNAAYLRHAELGRVDYFIRTKMWDQLKIYEYGIGFVALNIRYRRELRAFKSFYIETRPIYWNDVQLIMEQKFIDPNTKFLHTTIYCKYVLTKNGKRVKKTKHSSLNNDGFYKIKWYSNHHIVNTNENNTEYNAEILSSQPIEIVHSSSSESTQNGFIENEQGQIEPLLVANTNNDALSYLNDRNINNVNRNYLNIWECRNTLPRSLKIWMQCLQQSSYESRSNLYD